MPGNEIAILVDELQNAGNYSVTFRGDNLASGVYFYTLTASDMILAKSMLLIKNKEDLPVS